METLRARVITPIGARYMAPIGLTELKESGNVSSDYRIDLVRKIEGKLIFVGEDFRYWQQLDTSLYRCDVTSIQIQKLRPGTSEEWDAIQETGVSMRTGIWDYSRCTVEFNLVNDDRYNGLDDNKDKEYNVLNPLLVANRYAATFTDISGGASEIKNGVRCYDALAAMLSDIYGSANIVSDFFGWNSQTPGYVIGNNNALKFLLLFQKSDVTRRNVGSYTPATVMNLKPIVLIEDLCKMFNLKYRIDESGIFRIEHVSWWVRPGGIDLTASPYAEQVAGLNKFQYDTEKYYRREVFTTEGNEILLTASVDFGDGVLTPISAPIQNPQMVGVPIVYDNECLIGLPNENEYKREVGFIVDLFFNSGDGLAGPDSDFKGTFLIATDEAGSVQHEFVQYPEPPGIFAIPENPNNVLGWPQLHHHYYLHERIFKVGSMNNVITTFISVKASRKKENVSIIICDGVIDQFKYVSDELGPGVISAYSYRYGTGVVELELMFELDNSTVITAPVANDDNYYVLNNTTLDTLTAGRPSVLANDVGAVEVFAEKKKTARNGTIEIHADGHFIYTPVPGIFGRDTFDYAALNAAGRADIATVNLGIRPPALYVRQQSISSYLGTGTGGPSYNYSRTLSWYSDPAGTVAIDVTGMNIIFNFSQDLPGTIIEQGLGEGYTQTVWGPNPTANTFWQIKPGPNYTILP